MGKTSKAGAAKKVLYAKDFYTVDRAEQGIKVPLRLPSGGATDYWLHCRGIDAPSYREVMIPLVREIKALEASKEADAATKAEDLNLRLVAAFVIGWNLPDEFTEEGVLELLRKTPRLRVEVDTSCAVRSNFFALAPFAS